LRVLVHLGEGVNTIHLEGCPLVEGLPTQEYQGIGEALRSLKQSKTPGRVEYCPHCKPQHALPTKALSQLRVETATQGCKTHPRAPPAVGLEVEDTKSIWSRLVGRLSRRKVLQRRGG